MRLNDVTPNSTKSTPMSTNVSQGRTKTTRSNQPAHRCTCDACCGGVLLRADCRGDRLDHARRHLELCIAIRNAKATRDPGEIGVEGPDIAILVLLHQQTHGPVEPRLRIRRDEL